MRNLKRALSLALAAMMLIGMMVVSANAAASKDFTDKDEITHPEAVNTLVALDVIAGKEDGSYFDPTGTLTRAEMAKLVTYILSGGVEPVLGTKVTPTYSDIKGHWAEAYIEYCTSMNIIVGDGTGKFNPEGTLTASQCAKMLLTAMNYKDDVFGFLGDSWEINVNREANSAGLYEDLAGIAASNPISRDNAAQMVYNAIQANSMQLSWSQNMSTGEVTQSYQPDGPTLFADKFKGKVWIGTFEGDDNTTDVASDGEIVVNGKLDTASEDTADTDAAFPYELDLSNIGEQVKVLFKDGTGGTAGEPDKKDTIYGVYNTGATKVVNAILGDVKDQKSADAKINVGGTKYNTTDTVEVVTNYKVDAAATLNAKDGTADTNSALTAALKAANGNTVKFVFNSDNKINKAYVVESFLGTVTAVNSEKITISGLGSIKIADNDVYAGVAKNDVVVYTQFYDNTLADAYVSVVKAEVVSGTVDSFKAAESVTVDGTVYKIWNGVAMADPVGGETGTTAFTADDIGETFDLYMVNGYVRAAVQTSESASNYSIVLADNGGTAGSTFNGLELQVMDAQGNKSIITVSDDSAKTAAADYPVGAIVVYTGDASSAVVTIKATPADGTKSYNDTTKAFDGVVSTSDAVLFAETTVNKYNAGGTKFKAYNLRSLKNFTATSYAVVTDDNDKVVAVFADLTATPGGATSTTVYGIVTSFDGTVKIDSTTYQQFSVGVNDEAYTVYMPSTSTKIAKGDLVSFEPSSDNTYADADVTVYTDPANIDAVYVKEYSEADGTLTYYTSVTKQADDSYLGDAATQTTLALDDDCAIVYVDADGVAAGDEIGISAFDSVTGYANVGIVTKVDGADTVIVAIFVETSGEADIL